jgi:hypothetical protein
MRQIMLSFGLVALAVAIGIAQSPARQVQIEVTLQNDPHPIHPLLTVVEGNTASLEIPNVGKFGFVPNVKTSDSTTLVVDVLDLSQTPAKKLDTVETSVHGAAAFTKTTPEFRIRAIDIEPK